MKNIIKSSLLILCGVAMLTACSNDRDSNPTIKQPASFVLNTPAYATAGIDLATSTAINFTWSQPDYGFPAATEYQLQVSPTNSWTTSVAQAQADESGATKADYKTLDDIYTSCTGAMSASALATALEQIEMWGANAVPESQTVYVRAAAYTRATDTITSNVVEVNVHPYYVELRDAEIEIWYLVGDCIGDGSWGNSGMDNVGTSLIPMYPKANAEFDKATGKGVITYVGYFPANGGFKLIKTPGNWDDQWGASGDSYVKNDGGSSNITIGDAGYYQIDLNTATDELTVTPYEGNVSTYATITMPGSYQGWDAAGNAMSPMSTLNENHDWVATVTFDADAPSDGGVKFAIGSWDYDWGNKAFPYGYGTKGGDNILFKAGTYKVYFNDILGAYRFVQQ